MKLTYEQYDELSESIKNLDTNAKPAFPTQEEINKYVRPNFEKYVLYVMFVLERGNPLTEEEKISRKELTKLMYEKIQFLDND